MKNNNLIVTHSNKLTEARYSLTVSEQRIVLFMISQIQPQDEDFKDYEISVLEFTKLLGLKNKNVYEQTKKVLHGLLSKVLYVPKEDNSYLMTGWVSSAEYKDSEGIVYLTFDRKLKPYLLALKEQFTKYKLFTVTHFGSTYSIRIYMLLKQYASIGMREFELSEFRELLGLGDKYPRFADFRKRVINTAKSEFTKKDASGNYISDITFELETITHKRKITRLRFIIKNQKTEIVQIELPMVKEQGDIPSIITEYEAYGISNKITLPYLEEQGEQNLIDCLALFREKMSSMDIPSPSGYLLGMLNNGAGKLDQAKIEKKKRQQKELQVKKEAEYQKKQQAQREKLERTFSKAEITKYLSEFTKEEAEDLLDQAKKDSPMLSSMMTSLDSPMCLAFLLPRIPDYEKNKEAYIKQNLKL